MRANTTMTHAAPAQIPMIVMMYVSCNTSINYICGQAQIQSYMEMGIKAKTRLNDETKHNTVDELDNQINTGDSTRN